MRFFEIATGLLLTLLVGQALHATASMAGQTIPSLAVRQFDLTARRYEFVPNLLQVNQGDRVKITIRSGDGTHGFSIRKLGVKQEVPRGGEPVVVEFEASRPGTFEIACSEYCGKGHPHMKATLVVLPTGPAEGGRQ